MKVGFSTLEILHAVSSRRPGGAERSVVLTIEAQRGLGSVCYLACRPGSWMRGAAGALASGIVTAPFKGWLGLGVRLTERKLRSFIAHQRIQVVHTHQRLGFAAAFPAARAVGVPTVHTVHNLGENPGWMSADLIVAVSRAVADDIISRGADARRVEVVHNGVNIPKETPTGRHLREELGIPNDAPTIAMVGRLDWNKGCDLLLQAVSALPHVRCLLAGNGEPLYEHRLKKEALSLGLAERVTFLGHRDDADAIMATADIVALPSRSEGCPLVVLEAMAQGKPVVTSDAGGMPEIVEDGVTGLLFRSEDVAGLAAALRTLVSGPVLGKQMGLAGRRRVEEQFTAERMCRRLLQLYENVRAAHTRPDGAN